jgi:hypothetical protein
MPAYSGREYVSMKALLMLLPRLQGTGPPRRNLCDTPLDRPGWWTASRSQLTRGGLLMAEDEHLGTQTARCASAKWRSLALQSRCL